MKKEKGKNKQTCNEMEGTMEENWVRTTLVTLLTSEVFSKQKFEEFVSNVYKTSFVLKEGDAVKLLERIGEIFPRGVHEIDEQNTKFLSNLTRLLTGSPAFGLEIIAKGPEYVKKSLPVHHYLLSNKPQAITQGVNFVVSLIETCPGFNKEKYQEFVEESKEVNEILSKAIKDATPASEIPSIENLSQRLQVSLTKRFEINKELRKQLPFNDATLINQMGQHLRQIQQEMLENDEQRWLDIIQILQKKLTKALKEGDEEGENAIREQISKNQEYLKEIHDERRSKQKERLEEKKEILEKTNKMTDEVKKELEIQGQMINHLEQIYKHLYDARNLSYFPNELSYLDQLIGDVFELSLSIVVAGVIKVGKSTVINSFLNENLSPHRLETMTSIPTRYVNDPTATEPKMIVPFSNQLNEVISNILKFLKDFGEQEEEGAGKSEEEWLKIGKEKLLSYVKTESLRVLVNKICDPENKLVIQPQYTGSIDVLEASTDIHDIYRLAVDEFFEDQVSDCLPLDWNYGFRTYLTVYLPIPGRSNTGLINFSIVDTPGVNEHGVRKLGLHDQIEDALDLSNFGILIVDISNFNSIDVASILPSFLGIRTTYNTPCRVIATHCESIKNNEVEETKKNVSQLSTTIDKKAKTIFTEEEVHLVSAKKYFYSASIQKYLQKNGKSPLKDLPPTVKKMFEEWVLSYYPADEDSDKFEGYESMNQKEVEDRCTKLMKFSKMEDVFSDVSKAMDNCVTTCCKINSKKAKDQIQLILDRLENLKASTRLEKTELLIKSDIETITEKQNALKANIDENLKNYFSQITTQQQQIINSLRSISERTSLDSLDLTKFDSFFIENLKSDQEAMKCTEFFTKDIVYFENEKVMEIAFSRLCGKMKSSIQTYLVDQNENIIKEVQNWGQVRGVEIKEALKKIEGRYNSELKIKSDIKEELNLREPFDVMRNHISFNHDLEYQQLVKTSQKKNKKFTFFFSVLKGKKGKDGKYEVSSSFAKEKLFEYGKRVTNESILLLKSQVHKIVAGTIQKFIEDVCKEIVVLRNSAEEILLETRKRREELHEPRKTLITDLSQCLTSLENFEKQQLNTSK